MTFSEYFLIEQKFNLIFVKTGECRFKPDAVGAKTSGFMAIPSNESVLTDAIANVGPIAVVIDASHDSFFLYSKGVYYEPLCGIQLGLNRAVLVVGYGETTDGQQYYIVKNAWSTQWGQSGYILMSRNRNNNCGIATAASYPIV
jgi:cathepsin L